MIVRRKNDTPAPILADIEKKLAAIGEQAARVDDDGWGNVHCGTNTKKSCPCANFTDCLP